MNLTDILEALGGLPEAEREALVATAAKATESQVWVPNPGPQTEAYFCEADELFFGGQAGGGKALEVTSPVLTPTGWKPIGTLKVGDYVCATDSTVQEVLGVFPQGQRPLYRVTMRDGGSVLADLDHNWLAWRTHGNQKQANVVVCGKESARIWTTRQMLAEMEKGHREDGRTRAFAFPVTQPVRFNVAGQLRGRGNFVPREIDPYLLGLILGDGCIQPKSVSISTADNYIVERIQTLAENDVAIDTTKGEAVTCRFRGSFKQYLLAALERLGLSETGAPDKFIPRQYLFAPIEVRWEILRGLLDTDGWVEDKRAIYFTSCSKRLADDVAHLAQSLGGVTSRTVKNPTFTYQNTKKQGLTAHCVRIKAPTPVECFALPRKREVASGIKHQSLSRIIDKIEYERDGEAVCITVSNANSLYVTQDFIVTHNSDLTLGLALTQHTRSLILRRTNKEALGLVERTAEIMGNRDGWSGQQGIWRITEGTTVEMNGVQLEEDKQKFKGIPHDLYGFDEVSDFTESQYTFIIGWNRSTKPGQRCRVVATGNPPTRPEGLWVIRRWAAWIDPNHPNPAKPGELRWYTTGEDGNEIEVDGRGPHYLGGEWIEARSRTFIPSKLSDNPDLAGTSYAATLAALPAELRAAYRDGRFDIGLKDNAFQVIPTAWVRAAQQRWKSTPPDGVPMCAIGVDASGGGTDPMILAPRYDGWYAPLIEIPGKELPMDRMGAYASGYVLAHRKGIATIVIDMSGGYGSSMYEHLKSNNLEPVAYKGAMAATGRDHSRQFGFLNRRSQTIWRFREALDPEQEGGSPVFLPPDQGLLADLTAPSYEIRGGNIAVESKENVCKRLGRSTDRGDAVVMAWTTGNKMPNIAGGFASLRNKRPQVILGHTAQRRSR